MPAFLPVFAMLLAFYGYTGDACQKDGLDGGQCIERAIDQSVPDYSNLNE